VIHAKAPRGTGSRSHFPASYHPAEKLTRVEARRIHVDKGCRGSNYPQKSRVWIIRQVRRITASIPLETKRRAAVHAMLPSLGYIPMSVECKIAFARSG
jgi:transposase, IS5 family